MNSTISASTVPEGKLYIVGKNVLHTIAPPMHNFIAQEVLSRNYVFEPRECETVEEAIKTLRGREVVAGLVTMPYKTAIMPYLDDLDPLARWLNACNCVYISENGRRIGTNTDWIGIRGCLLSASEKGKGKPACIIGAGGASRAAAYALWADLGCPTIYIINRDRAEVEALVADVERMAHLMAADKADSDFPSCSGSPQPRRAAAPSIVHLESTAQADSIVAADAPYYVVGTVPDFEPITPSEILVRDVFEVILTKEASKGVFLDMCYKPRVTRQIKRAQSHGWPTVEGTGIIGHQIEQQWWLWTRKTKTLSREDQEQAWAVLRATAETSPAINF